MNSSQLKWIAIITMTCDHLGFYLFPEGSLIQLVLRSLGRIAFPLFAFFIAEGFVHTHDIKKYFLRLFVFALVIEVFFFGFYLFTDINYMITENIFWTLLLGLLALMMISTNKWYYITIALSFIFLSYFLRIPYGGFGVALIILFGTIKNRLQQLLYVALFTYLYIGLMNVENGWVQWFGILAFLPLFFYNGKLGKMNKYFFYVYYPAHIIVIVSISMFLQ